MCTDEYFPTPGYECTDGFRISALVGALTFCVLVGAAIKHLASVDTDRVAHEIGQPGKSIIPIHSLKIAIISWQILSQVSILVGETLILPMSFAILFFLVD